MWRSGLTRSRSSPIWHRMIVSEWPTSESKTTTRLFGDIHCDVTGQDESGKSVIVRNTPVKPVSLALVLGYEFHRLWGSDSIPELPSDGTPLPR